MGLDEMEDCPFDQAMFPPRPLTVEASHQAE